MAAALAERLRALAAAPVAHESLLRVVDAGLEGATPFLVLEYATGESLDVVLRQSGPMPVARALPILRAVGAAIDAAWLAGAGHGALHPRDIFIAAGSDDVRVNGAGIGQALDALGIKAAVRRPYSAPERAAGAAWDVRSDVYSLGVIAHELLAGKRPVTSDEADLVGAELSPEARSAVRRILSAAVSEDP